MNGALLTPPPLVTDSNLTGNGSAGSPLGLAAVLNVDELDVFAALGLGPGLQLILTGLLTLSNSGDTGGLVLDAPMTYGASAVVTAALAVLETSLGQTVNGFFGACIARCTPFSGGSTVAGISSRGGTDANRRVTFCNLGPDPLTFAHQDNRAGASDRLALPGHVPLVLQVDDSVTLLYDVVASLNRWRVLR